MFLSEIKEGQEAVIQGYADESVPARFYEMGLLPGVHVQMKHKAPFSGPVCIRVDSNDYFLALRKSEAASIIISLENE